MIRIAIIDGQWIINWLTDHRLNRSPFGTLGYFIGIIG